MHIENDASHIDLEHLSEADVAILGVKLQALGRGATSRQMVAERIVSAMFESLRIAKTGEPACVLVRCFQTATYARMPTHYQDAADVLLQDLPSQRSVLDQMRCLALLATQGLKPVWNDVLTSLGHQAIPLPSVEVVSKAPMIAKLLEQLGMSIERAVAPPDSPDMQLQSSPGEFSVFYIQQAIGSPFIPAQNTFVEPHGVRSVLGMGGILPDGELLAVILFARVAVSPEVAARFGTLASEVRRLMMAFAPAQTFRRAEF